ncbi:MAG: site-2 protease family protein [Clostridiales bacterium]|nr:site-2 protease family protein [Clostridiales bacterium]
MLDFIEMGLGVKEVIVLTISMTLVLLISFSLHEYAHALIAYKNGDMTAKSLGRLTVNPLAHIDPIGFVCCMLFNFGWAKPVPINPLHFRNYKKGIVATSIAGVITNLILAFIGCGLYFAYVLFLQPLIVNQYLSILLGSFLYFLFNINICLMVFNLLPIPPLDGFNVINAVTKYGNKFVQFMERYGTIILLMILIFGSNILGWLISYVALPIELLWSWIFGLFL